MDSEQLRCKEELWKERGHVLLSELADRDVRVKLSLLPPMDVVDDDTGHELFNTDRLSDISSLPENEEKYGRMFYCNCCGFWEEGCVRISRPVRGTREIAFACGPCFNLLTLPGVGWEANWPQEI